MAFPLAAGAAISLGGKILGGLFGGGGPSREQRQWATGMQGYQQNYMDMARRFAAGIGQNSGPFSADQISAYQNPYEAQVIAGMQSDYDRQVQQMMANADALATKSGAYGGSRHGAMIGSQAGEMARGLMNSMAQYRSQNYNNALQQLNADRSFGFQSDIGRMGMLGQGMNMQNPWNFSKDQMQPNMWSRLSGVADIVGGMWPIGGGGNPNAAAAGFAQSGIFQRPIGGIYGTP